MKIVVAITGASGVIHGIKLLEELAQKGVETHLIISQTAEKIIEYETNYKIEELKQTATQYHEEDDLFAIINSGSFRTDATIVIPCSMKTLAAISTGYADNAITRACDVALKERHKLIIVPRETPLRTTHLENMTKLSREGAIILPAMPGYYHKPETLDDQVNFISGKILDLLDINNNLFSKWKQ